MERILLLIRDRIAAGDEEGTKKSVGEALASGLEPRKIMEHAMMAAMEDIGERFSRNEAFIPELIIAAAAMQEGMGVLKPRLAAGEKGNGLIVLGTVYGDIHSIGKNLVRMCMEGAGFEVVDLGEDLKTQAFVEAYEKHEPDILGLSALLSSTMQHMKEVINAVRAIDPSALIMVGGAPITADYASEINASGYAPNAFEAALKAKELLA